MADELEFIANGRTGTVHILAARGGRGYRPDQPWPASLTREHADTGVIWTLATQPALALCGWVAYTSSAFDDYFTDCFTDDRLCRGCYRRLDPEDVQYAFEHDQPQALP
jgi:hypothetical protein